MVVNKNKNKVKIILITECLILTVLLLLLCVPRGEEPSGMTGNSGTVQIGDGNSGSTGEDENETLAGNPENERADEKIGKCRS